MYRRDAYESELDGATGVFVAAPGLGAGAAAGAPGDDGEAVAGEVEEDVVEEDVDDPRLAAFARPFRAASRESVR